MSNAPRVLRVDRKQDSYLGRRFIAALLAVSVGSSAALAQVPPAPEEAGAGAGAGTSQNKAAAPGPEVNPIRGSEVNEKQRAAVERGLAFLAARQAPSGAIGMSNSTGAGDSGYSVAITALAGLAFMQAGNLPGRGKYGANVRKAAEFICRNTSEAGLISADNSLVPMYGHGFATLFLAEVYGMSQIDGRGNDEVKEKLTRAVRLILDAHAANKEGGWRYLPRQEDADISVTICQVMALRAARDAGIRVPKSNIDRALAYVRDCQNQDDGGFSYQKRGGPSGFARTAAGIASLFYAGVYEGEDVKMGLGYLRRYIANQHAPGEGESHYFYGHYYAVQAMFLAGGDYWGTYYPAIRDALCKRQSAQGGWSGDYSEEYSTAMALLILQMPNRYLPVFIGKGPGG